MFAATWNEDLIVRLAAALVALGVIWRYMIRPAYRGIVAAFRTVDRVEKAVAFVEAELKPNGGSSLRDAVNRIEAKVDNHESRLIAVEHALSSVSQLSDAVHALEAKLREPVISSTTTKTTVKTIEPAHREET